MKIEEQGNLTDDESRMMKVASGGLEQHFNAQALVYAESMMVVLVAHVPDSANDKEQETPMVAKVQTLPEALNQSENNPDRQRLFQRVEGRDLRRDQDHSPDCGRSRGASSSR